MNAPMSVIETPVTIVGADGMRIGIATNATRIADKAVLIVPAPGETRTGPDRLYVRLARELARAGLPSLRFDPADGGDSRPTLRDGSAYREDLIAAARQLLRLHPDSFVAVLAVGRAAGVIVREWQALVDAGVPLSALCLIDPPITPQAVIARPAWWRRILGKHAQAVERSEPVLDGGERIDLPGEGQSWHALPDAVRAARARMLVVARGDDSSSDAVVALAQGDRRWRKALRKSRGWLQIHGAEPGFTQAEHWRPLIEWLATRLAD